MARTKKKEEQHSLGRSLSLSCTDSSHSFSSDNEQADASTARFRQRLLSAVSFFSGLLIGLIGIVLTIHYHRVSSESAFAQETKIRQDLKDAAVDLSRLIVEFRTESTQLIGTFRDETSAMQELQRLHLRSLQANTAKTMAQVNTVYGKSLMETRDQEMKRVIYDIIIDNWDKSQVRRSKADVCFIYKLKVVEAVSDAPYDVCVDAFREADIASENMPTAAQLKEWDMELVALHENALRFARSWRGSGTKRVPHRQRLLDRYKSETDGTHYMNSVYSRHSSDYPCWTEVDSNLTYSEFPELIERSLVKVRRRLERSSGMGSPPQ